MDDNDCRSTAGYSALSDELAGTQKEILESLKHLTQKLDRVSVQGAAPQAIPQVETNRVDQEAELRDLYKELESLEHALNNEREKAATLADEKDELEAAHSRDIASLEAMLQQVCQERDRLATENRRLVAENERLKQGRPVPDPARDLLEQSIHLDKAKIAYYHIGPGSRTPTVEEPDLEQSCGLSSSGSSLRGY